MSLFVTRSRRRPEYTGNATTGKLALAPGIDMRYVLKDKVVLITGASEGIGRACAVEFHQAGSCVVAAARSLEKLEALACELGDRVTAFRLDVTDKVQRQAAVAATLEKHGRIDVLINNAGWASFGTVLKTPQEHLNRMIDLNFLGPIALIQAVLPQMIGRGSGQIINISSVVGTQAIPRMTVYSATKSALNALSTGLRMELRGTGVDVLSVSPSSTNTAFFRSAATVDARATRIAETQYTPERVARAIVRSSRRRRAEVTLSLEGKTITTIRRISHRLADGIMFHVAKRAMPETRE